ncbi:hypothetical protein, partial [Frateuria sp.]|uniref:hypothetical protein n=1 Tax=Frateuria sp. TaxID=2211372 RepID=UPI003F7D644C
MEALSKANPKTRLASRKSLAGAGGKATMSGGRSVSEKDDQIVEFEYDDGYPAGFTIVDNRDIWQGPKRFQMLKFSLRTVGAWTALVSFPPGWVIS